MYLSKTCNIPHFSSDILHSTQWYSYLNIIIKRYKFHKRGDTYTIFFQYECTLYSLVSWVIKTLDRKFELCYFHLLSS